VDQVLVPAVVPVHSPLLDQARALIVPLELILCQVLLIALFALLENSLVLMDRLAVRHVLPELIRWEMQHHVLFVLLELTLTKELHLAIHVVQVLSQLKDLEVARTVILVNTH